MGEDNQGFILVVDDNEMNRDMLSRRLNKQGYEVMVAENGVHALKLMGENEFDLVLLDIMMPQMNGYEVLEHVKQDEAFKRVPIIMISAVDDLDSVVKCIEMGAEDYLFKPFNPVLLKARIKAGLDRKRAYERELIASNASDTSPNFNINQHQDMLNETRENLNLLLQGQVGPVTSQQSEILERILADVEQILANITT